MSTESIEKDIAALVLELSNSRNTDRIQAEASRKDEAEAERERIMGWFTPVMDYAKALESSPHIKHQLHLFMYNHVSTVGSKPLPSVSIEISARDCYYSADCHKYVITPRRIYNPQSEEYTNKVEVKKQKRNAHGSYPLVSKDRMSVAEACTLLTDRTADMLRHR